MLALIHFLIPGRVSAGVLRGIGSARQKQVAESAGSDIVPARKPLRQIALDPVFWMLAAAFGVHTFIGNGITFHVIPLLQERGYAMGVIVAMLAMHGPSQVAARIVLLLVGNRISTAGFGYIAFSLMTVGVALLGLSSVFGAAELFVYALIYGIGTGLLTLVRANSVIEYLGAYGYGAATGALTMAVTLPRTTAAVAFALVLVQLMIMPDILLVENYKTMAALGLVDTLLAIGLPYFASAFAIFLLRQTFLGIPKELDEAARVEGASAMQVLWRVYVPLAKPVYTAFALVSVSFHWNNFLWPLIITNSVNSRPLTVGLQVFSSVDQGVDWSIITAATLMTSAPLLIAFLLFQRQFVQSFMRAGIK